MGHVYDYGSWTYGADFDLPRDRVRFAIGDTLAEDQLVLDEEVAAMISQAGSESAAAVRLCRHLAARFARQADETTSDAAGNSRTKSLSQRAAAFFALAEHLEASGAMSTTPMPFAGGIGVADVASRELDSDRVSPAFRVGMSDYH